MTRQDQVGERADQTTGGRPPPVKGPWDNLPKAKPVREPIIRRSGRPRESIVTNWRVLLIFAFLFLVAPSIIAWISGLALGFFSQR